MNTPATTAEPCKKSSQRAMNQKPTNHQPPANVFFSAFEEKFCAPAVKKRERAEAKGPVFFFIFFEVCLCFFYIFYAACGYQHNARKKIECKRLMTFFLFARQFNI
jgi:hypothetical protein